jgi:hypothetical protein
VAELHKERVVKTYPPKEAAFLGSLEWIHIYGSTVRLLHMLNSRDQLTKPHSEFQSRTQTFRADDWLEPLGRGVVPGPGQHHHAFPFHLRFCPGQILRVWFFQKSHFFLFNLLNWHLFLKKVKITYSTDSKEMWV